MVSQAVAKGDIAALNYFIAEKYLKAFSLLAESPNMKTLILPMETTGVLGSLSGIAEIAKATFGGEPRGGADGKAPPPARRPSGPPMPA
jgi:hypothetical protein